MTPVQRWTSGVLVLSALLVRPALAADRGDKREIIRQARAAYYSLRRSGLDSYQVNITVDWDVVLGPGQATEQRKNALRLLNGLHFGQSFDASGKSIITHRADIPAPNAQAQSGYDQIFTGMDQAISGFMDTYQLFMVTSPFPAVNGDYVVEDAPYGYRLTYKDGNSDVVTRMSKSFAIIEMIVNAPDFDSSIRPSFTTTDGLFVLANYDGEYRPTKTKTGVVKLSAQIEHTVVDSLRLPRKVAIRSSIDEAPAQTNLTYSDYTIKKR
jgi:hypothetical protein